MKKELPYVSRAYARRAAEILRRRKAGESYTEIGAAVGLSSERVRQILKAATPGV